MQQVYVVEYSHKHGTDVVVCATEARADRWIKETVAEQWDSEMNGEAMPTAIQDSDVSKYTEKSGASFDVSLREVLE